MKVTSQGDYCLFAVLGPFAPNSELIISGRKLIGGLQKCNGWQGGDPRTPGWKLTIVFLSSGFGSGASVSLATGAGRVQFSTDVGTNAGLSCPLDGYTFAQYADAAEFPCQWSLN